MFQGMAQEPQGEPSCNFRNVILVLSENRILGGFHHVSVPFTLIFEKKEKKETKPVSRRVCMRRTYP